MLTNLIHHTFLSGTLFLSYILQEAGCLFKEICSKTFKSILKYKVDCTITQINTFYEVNQFNQLQYLAKRANCLNSIHVTGSQFLTEK